MECHLTNLLVNFEWNISLDSYSHQTYVADDEDCSNMEAYLQSLYTPLIWLVSVLSSLDLP